MTLFHFASIQILGGVTLLEDFGDFDMVHTSGKNLFRLKTIISFTSKWGPSVV